MALLIRKRKIALGSGICMLVVAMTAVAQQAVWASPNDKTAQSLISLERQWAEQECTNKIVIYKILADDFEGTAPSGKRYKKPPPYTGGPLPKPEARNCRLDDIAVHFYGSSIAVLYGSESLERPGKHGGYEKHCLIWTDTWLKRHDAWQIVAAQDTKSKCK
ncbi:MAG TPA: nuclear transport factor 2 family protein [Rhodanobacteraceae bacterium]|nr:nuclear transport factor 2 family protein [Rhodanobacteraceae bacterium]